MHKIGLVDYFIDEWHSNNYLVWIYELCEKYGYDFEVSYAWAEKEEHEGRMTTDEWCAKNNITKCATLEELCEKSDYIMVLAPANPEKHLKYARTVLRYGKNTYIDKTFTQNLDEAKEIYALGEKYKTNFFSTSALRYATELDEYNSGINSLSVKGDGGCFYEYIIHQIEMTVKLMGIGAERTKVFNSGKQKMCVIEYKDGKTAFLSYCPGNPFELSIEDKNGNCKNKIVESEFFVGMLNSILKFFLSGEVPFDMEQTLECIRIRDSLVVASNSPDEWFEIK